MLQRSKSRLSDVIASLLIFLFVYTAISKLINLHQFKVVLEKSNYLKGYADLIAVLVPSLEIVISILLFFPISRRQGLLASTILMLLFTLYVGAMVVFLRELPCSCGGVIQTLSWHEHLIFNLVITFISYWGY